MTPNIDTKLSNHAKSTLKLNMPKALSDELKSLAAERALSLSAMIRLVLAEYVRTKK